MSLTAASYDGGLPSVSMSFDREINIDAFDPSSIIVKSDESGTEWVGVDGWTTDPVTMQVELAVLGPYAGSDTRLSVSADNGIVGADDGAIYPGVSDLVLPFA